MFLCEPMTSKKNRLKSAIPTGAELRGITQIFETAIPHLQHQERIDTIASEILKHLDEEYTAPSLSHHTLHPQYQYAHLQTKNDHPTTLPQFQEIS